MLNIPCHKRRGTLHSFLKFVLVRQQSRRLKHMICAVDACNATILFQINTELVHLGLRACGTGHKQSSQILSSNVLGGTYLLFAVYVYCHQVDMETYAL